MYSHSVGLGERGGKIVMIICFMNLRHEFVFASYVFLVVVGLHNSSLTTKKA